MLITYGKFKAKDRHKAEIKLEKITKMLVVSLQVRNVDRTKSSLPLGCRGEGEQIRKRVSNSEFIENASPITENDIKRKKKKGRINPGPYLKIRKQKKYT